MARGSSKKLSKEELRQAMLAIRAEIIRKIEAVDVGLSDKPEDIKTRRAKVFAGDEAGFRFFAKTYFQHYFPDDTESEFHKWVYKTLPEVEKEAESISQAVAAPRGEAKTTLIAQIKTLYDEVRNVKHNNVIVSDTEEQADGIIEGIKTELETNPALALDFPEVCGKGAIWRIGEVRTRQGNKIKAYGQGQKIRGAKNGANRPDVVYLDDLENDDHVKNERLRKKLKDWIARVIQPLGGAGNKCDIFYVGTVLHIDSVLAQTLKNPFWRSALFSSILKWPDRMDLWDEWENIYRTEGEAAAKAFYAANEAEMLKGSQVSWSKRPMLVLMKIRARDGVDVFNTEYQNKPGNPEEAIFSEYIDGAYYATMPLDVVYYGAVDPSLGKKGKGRDPSAILVGGYQKKTGILFVEEARIKKRVPSLIIQEVIELQKQYGCLVWVIETVQFQEFFKDQLVKESAKLGIHVPARGVTPSVEKELRIESIQPHMSNGFIKLSQEHYTLLSQLREWPNHEHDDGPDALQMLWMAATTGANYKPTKVIHIPPTANATVLKVIQMSKSKSKIKAQKKQLKTSVNSLTSATSDALDMVMASSESTDQLLERLGISRQEAYAMITSDDEVESCREDLRMAMLARTWRLWGDGADDEVVSNRLWRIVRKHLHVLAEAVLTAKLNGYAVLRYIYVKEDDGFLTIDTISDKSSELDKYTPKTDGSLVYTGGSGEETVDTRVMYLLLTHRATSTNPAGEMAGARLYPAVALRKHGFIFAAQFIQRYAQPLLITKTSTNSTETEDETAKVYSLLNGGAMNMNREDDIVMLQNNADGQAFQRLDRMANSRIQKYMLGKVKTSDLENGSRAAQETEENTKGDRIDGYLHLLNLAAQHLVDALLMVNEAYGKTIVAPKGLWFEFNKKTEIDNKRADRDTKYAKDANLRFTEDYYIDVLGFEPNHFVLADDVKTPNAGNASLSARLSGKHKQGNPLNGFSQPKIDAIVSALDECESFADFEAKLSGMDLREGDNALIQRVLGDAVHEFIKGSEAQSHG